MEITSGVRRVLPDEPLPESDGLLVERIRDEIVSGGPMTFARFMELASYDPERGYYRAAETRVGRAGDFLTAPEAHPIFGHAVARALEEMWQILDRPDPFTLREYGAGSGSLALAVMAGLRSDRSPLLDALRYEPVEIGAARRGELADRLADAGFADRLALGTPGVDRAGEGEAGPQLVGCVLANEFLDALPVHRVAWRDGTLSEVFVGWEPADAARATPERNGATVDDGEKAAGPTETSTDLGRPAGGRFIDVLGPPSTPALADRLAADGVALAEGQRGEICLGLDAWIEEVGRTLRRGYVLVVDYGHPAGALYGPGRFDGTLRAYVRHHVGADPYVRVGRQDLTAHVDLTALARAGGRAGLASCAITTQAEFLVGAGAEELLRAIQGDPATTLPDYLELRAALRRMLDPGAMGRFAVVLLGRDVPADAPPGAFAYRLGR